MYHIQFNINGNVYTMTDSRDECFDYFRRKIDQHGPIMFHHVVKIDYFCSVEDR